jgi:hypothetical protein
MVKEGRGTLGGAGAADNLNALFMLGSAAGLQDVRMKGRAGTMETKMKKITKYMLGALMLGGVAASAAPASALTLGIGLGGPGYYGDGYGAVCDRYSRWYDPYRCSGEYGYYNDGPIWWGDNWYYGPTRYRYYGGHRQYYVGGGWRGDVRFGGGRGGYGGGGYHGGGGGGYHGGGGGYHGGGGGYHGGGGGYHGGGGHGGGGGGGGHHR